MSDALSRQVQLDNYHRGAPETITRPDSVVLNRTYNDHGQLVSVDYPDASPDVSMSYDVNGNLATATRGITAWTYNYDVMDRLIDQSLVVDGRTYLTSYTYESDGRFKSMRTPSGRWVDALSDGLGQPTAIRWSGFDYASGATYHPSGQLQSLNFGNGLVQTHAFNTRQQLIDVDIAGGGVTAFDHSYLYDANGRVADIIVNFFPSETRAFTYDALGRVSTASGPWGAGSYTYDLLNNIRSKSLGADTVEIEYNAANQISRARDTRDGNIWRLYGHDARGNVIDNARISFTYDRSDQPTAISGAATGSFVYDAHNRRVKQTLDGETIYSVYGVDGTLIHRDNVTTGETTDYLRLGQSGPTLVRLKTQAGVVTPTYTHNDHLGSASMGTSAGGSILWFESYTPFGEPLQTPLANEDNQGHTGHIQDTATGLTYMQARYYDPVIGRFLSNDPVGFAEGGAGFFNRYAYTFNDPVNHTDPTGMAPIPDWAVHQQQARDRAIASGDPEQLNQVVQQQARDGAMVAGTILAVFTPIDEAAVVGTAVVVSARTGSRILRAGRSRSGGDAVVAARAQGSSGGPGAGRRFSEATRDRAEERAGGRCVFCGTRTTREPGPNQRNTDHADSRSRGGNNLDENAQNTCRTCNIDKGARNNDEFIQAGGGRRGLVETRPPNQRD